MPQFQLTDLQEIFRALEEAGMNPRLCDTPITCFDTSVRAGMPTDIGDVSKDKFIMLPRELVGMHTRFVINVAGDSMKDANLSDGDQVSMELCCEVNEGDIVVVSINGEFTIKTYFKDEEGTHWLVPRNNAYKPIALTEEMDVHFFGRVVNIIKAPKRIEYSKLAECVNKVKMEMREENAELPRIEQAVRSVADKVKTGRQWYAVYRGLVSKKALSEGDHELFASLVREWLPLHPHPADAREMRRMEDGTFRLSPLLWDRNKAPVTGKRFDDYQNIALLTMKEYGRVKGYE